MRHRWMVLPALVATLAASPACDDKKGKSSKTEESDDGSKKKKKAEPALKKKISEVTKDDLGKAIEDIGWPKPSISTSGSFMTAVSIKDDNRLVVTHKTYADDKLVKNDLDNAEKFKFAVKADGLSVLKVELGDDRAAAQDILERLAGS